MTRHPETVKRMEGVREKIREAADRISAQGPEYRVGLDTWRTSLASLGLRCAPDIDPETLALTLFICSNMLMHFGVANDDDQTTIDNALLIAGVGETLLTRLDFAAATGVPLDADALFIEALTKEAEMHAPPGADVIVVDLRDEDPDKVRRLLGEPDERSAP